VQRHVAQACGCQRMFVPFVDGLAAGRVGGGAAWGVDR
jgi:hypothetical protein